MRAVFDTNVLVSALLSEDGKPAELYRAWLDDAFTLLTCAKLEEELRLTLSKSHLAKRIRPADAGYLVNRLRERALQIDHLPRVKRSPDPNDDYLLALAQAGAANYIVSGDKTGLLALVRHAGARIVSVSDFALILL